MMYNESADKQGNTIVDVRFWSVLQFCEYCKAASFASPRVTECRLKKWVLEQASQGRNWTTFHTLTTCLISACDSINKAVMATWTCRFIALVYGTTTMWTFWMSDTGFGQYTNWRLIVRIVHSLNQLPGTLPTSRRGDECHYSDFLVKCRGSWHSSRLHWWWWV